MRKETDARRSLRTLTRSRRRINVARIWVELATVKDQPTDADRRDDECRCRRCPPSPTFARFPGHLHGMHGTADAGGAGYVGTPLRRPGRDPRELPVAAA